MQTPNDLRGMTQGQTDGEDLHTERYEEQHKEEDKQQGDEAEHMVTVFAAPGWWAASFSAARGQSLSMQWVSTSVWWAGSLDVPTNQLLAWAEK